MTEKPDPRPLGLLGALLIGFGLSTRLLLPDEPSALPLYGALARIPMFAGAAVILLERVLRGGASLPWHWWLVPLAIVPGCFPTTAVGVTRAMDLLAACVVCFALRDLVTRDAMGPTIRRWAVALGIGLSVVGAAQVGWQRDDLREIVERNDVAEFSGETARAFLDSNRATSTLVNANAFAGLLLLVLALAPWTRKRWGIAAFVTCVFAATVSAGAALAALLACVARARDGKAWRIACAVGAAGVVVLATLLATGWRPPLIGDKVGTFAQRLDYHALGFRMLGDAGPFGAGLEATRELRWAHAVPGQAHSAYLHDTYLQLIVEVGPIGVLLAIAGFVLALRRGRATDDDTSPAQSPPAAIAMTFGIGVAAGGILPVLLNGVPRVLPMSWELPPILDVVIVVGCIIGCDRVLRHVDWSTSAARLWPVGLLAFALHGLLDYDLYTPAAATMFAVFCALAPGRPRTRPIDRVVVGLGAVVLLAMPLTSGAVAMAREAARKDLGPQSRAAGTRPDAALALLASMPDLGVLDALSHQFSGRDGALVEEALDSLPEAIRTGATVRRIEAEHLARRALVEPALREAARQRVMALTVDREEPVRAQILAARIRIERLLGQDAVVRDLARAALESLDRWSIDDPQLRAELESAAR